ncbi:MAG TPA: flagellar basal body P-ring protein FlgI [Terracidiphilus sp.]|nr:flagellar basal body P-ring protein FlgI [Terracidiphilus sp.]
MTSVTTSARVWLRSIAWALSLGCAVCAINPYAAANTPNRQVLVRDITSVEGVRNNMLVGYGLVVGLNRTGDSQQTYFTVQTLANAMQRMGVLISPGTVQVKNVAAVFITASLPPFSRPGAALDVTVSSAGDAKSLEGGVLLMSALHGPDGQVYAEAQGPLTVGGFSVGNGANTKQENTPTVGVIPNGAIVERDTAVDLHDFKVVSLLLRNPDFTTARQIADAINADFHKSVATALDSTRVDVSVPEAAEASVPVLISRVQNLSLMVHTPARIVVNERTGTIVLGGDVKLTPVSVIHGNLSIQVVTSYAVAPIPGAPIRNGPGTVVVDPRLSATPQGAQSAGLAGQNPASQNPAAQNPAAQNPAALSAPGQAPGADNVLPGQPAALVPETTVSADDSPAQTMRLDDGANVEELVNGLHAIGTTARDVVAILQAIKAEGGLQAELEVQ